MEEGTIIAAQILDGYYFYRVPVNADGCTFYRASGRVFMLFCVLPDSNKKIMKPARCGGGRTPPLL